MPVNNLSFNQLATVLNAVHDQATGKTSIAPTSTADFVTVAQETLLAGYDPVINALSQVLSNTIFSNRPYTAKFLGIEADARKWGGITRKIQIIDTPFMNDNRLPLTDGTSVDHYIINKPKVLQTNFYGFNIYKKYVTLFRDQLDTAFSGPEQFGEFLALVMSNVSDMLEQAREEMARMTIANLIGGKNAGDPTNVYHLLTEYNTATGLTLTKQDVYQPQNIRGFTEWLYARVGQIADEFEERSQKYQINITNKEIKRHTPKDKQHLYVYAPFLRQLETMVKSETFNDEYLRTADVEGVTYWQSIDSPDEIQVTPVYLKTDGTLETNAAAQTITDIIGVLFDDEAAGYTVAEDWSAATPLNADGGYTNVFFHRTIRYWNDFTEKCAVFLLD